MDENRERERHGARMLLRSVQHTPMSLAETIRLYGRAFRSRAITERDLRAFRRSYGDVLEPTPASTGGAALIASLSYSTYQLKLEGMFAKAFQLQGLEPVVLVPSNSELPRRYFETFGIRRFVTLDRYSRPPWSKKRSAKRLSCLRGWRRRAT